MTDITTTLRPRAQYLRQLPTLARQAPEEAPPRLRDQAQGKGIAFVLELKLETPGARYWLCAQGVPEVRPGVSKSLVVDYITPEYQRPDGTWELADTAAYGPQNTTWLQGNDYLQMLTDEYERLQREQEAEPNWRTTQQLEITREEMRQVVAQMDAIVRQRQAPSPR
jgi:hypothetical protein